MAQMDPYIGQYDMGNMGFMGDPTFNSYSRSSSMWMQHMTMKHML